jgi:hypothetical protein
MPLVVPLAYGATPGSTMNDVIRLGAIQLYLRCLRRGGGDVRLSLGCGSTHYAARRNRHLFTDHAHARRMTRALRTRRCRAPEQ